MPASVMQWVAALGFAGIGVLFMTELRRWKQLGSVIGRGQRALRVCLITLVEALFVMMYLGPWITDRRDPLAELLYWTVCLLLGLAVIVLALVEMREVTRAYARMCRRTFADLDSESRRTK